MQEAGRLSAPEAERILSAVLQKNSGKAARNLEARRPSRQSSSLSGEARKRQVSEERRITAIN
jgi:hypothetical protein